MLAKAFLEAFIVTAAVSGAIFQRPTLHKEYIVPWRFP